MKWSNMGLFTSGFPVLQYVDVNHIASSNMNNSMSVSQIIWPQNSFYIEHLPEIVSTKFIDWDTPRKQVEFYEETHPD